MTQPDPSAAGIETALNIIGASANGQTFDEYRWSQLTDRIVVLEEQMRAVFATLDAYASRIRETGDRLSAIENAATPAKRDRDDLGDRIVALLESAPTLKFSAISVDENLGGTGKDISDRLKTLAKNGRILMHTEEGRRPFYQALPAQDAQPS